MSPCLGHSSQHALGHGCTAIERTATQKGIPGPETPLEPCRLWGTGLSEEQGSPWCGFVPVPAQNSLWCAVAVPRERHTPPGAGQVSRELGSFTRSSAILALGRDAPSLFPGALCELGHQPPAGQEG